jgi:hypothetical protein
LCGLIQPSSAKGSDIGGSHRKPYPDEKEPTCKGGYTTRGIVLGTDFITDVLLISIKVETPLDLTPTYLSTTIALRTMCEALSKAACSALELDPSELQAEFRPAVNELGSEGREMELYLYDTLSGGAGFSKQVEGLGESVFIKALSLLEDCPESCDRSCYRCLRSYKNKFDHEFLDRHVGATLLRYLLHGTEPSWEVSRLEASRDILYEDLSRADLKGITVLRNHPIQLYASMTVVAPIYVSRGGGSSLIIDVSGALTPGVPADPVLAKLIDEQTSLTILLVEELTVRRNLPEASSSVWERLGV